MYLQLLGARNECIMCSPVCLVKKETKLFTNKLPKYFNESECKLIMDLLKH